MSVTIDFQNLLDYSNAERSKWRGWMAADPGRLKIPFQSDGRFPTVGSLLDHVFLVERRHLARLEGGVPPEATGVAPGDWEALFDYADLVRSDLRRYVAELDESTGAETITFAIPKGTFTMSCRKLTTHILLHEIRHLAQMAYAARLAGHAPPGDHDYFFFPED